ncbi:MULTISPECIES: lysine-sensitive aspartokinase 3 [unclassified Shewanella]|uniref:lysine-sensitive aspartokinase 3 n=1 Tax=unclassified Shewanella TaxID=196818 RepID=UPI000C863093|nr:MULTISPECIES: lysine-sensitive aspartokinase 3 [unclassified Shewanella]MDO6620318.1 lysine-sensitive aspartokinase 3 [Shewanella sp. 6_MG-2023]MDO6638605.1 lysine-sensitive aspartokinase 3 [Shewanella sp. 5_MG-2023]MDO6774575.1 lysine-sensitive aspartokinase 3 [Shewanella sp. 3_MG-2023]PMG32236.1 lysine-sensitive aspartokinase 3 [Shewanella sp. 10N.286.52.C2]PMG45216.1 lysine-sensitive aspartokinase 3 [Shewanella sp. 10N.286.52.B9]
MSLVVAKFGGTSVADFDAMNRCADIILANANTRVVVVSASSGVTNLLVELTQANVNDQRRLSLVTQIAKIQYDIVDKLARPQDVAATIDKLLSRMAVLSDKLVLDRSKAIIDELLSMGEQCSSLLFSAVIRQKGTPSSSFDVRQVLRTDSHFGKAEPQIEQIALLGAEHLQPLLAQQVIVTQGFIGADEAGNTTTLGRGGSDYSAALLAEALKADAVEIWTDVAGIYTTDPRLAPNARPIAEISFNEAAEMATFGAKVLHPATILPAVRQQIQVFVGSSKAPEQGGTWIRHQVEDAPVYRAVALRRDQTLLNLHSLQMLHAQGFLAHTFATLAKHKISVDLITTSEVNVSLTLDKTGSDSSGQGLLSESLLQELSQNCRVRVEDKLALVAIIGNQIASTAGICSRVFGVLEQHNVRMICQGASPHNLCVLVAESEAADVVNSLHQNLFE